MKKLLSLILSFLMVLSTLPFVMASADVVLPETYGNDADFAALISDKSSVTLDKDYVLTEPVSCSISTLILNGFTITYNPSAGNESANVITSTKAITVNVDTTDTAYEKANGTFVNYGTGYFFKSSTVTLQGKGSYGDGKTYGDLSVDGNLMPKTNSTYYHYGDFVVTGKTSLSGDTTKFYGNIDTKDFYFERVVELQGYLHTTGNDVNLGKCNPYSGHCQTIYFTGTDTYNGYTIYCEGNATYAFNTEKITLNTNNGRNILNKDMYVGGNLNITWFGHTELGFAGKVVVDGNLKVNNYQAKKSTNHPTVTDPKNITFADLTCTSQSLQLTENYHNADVENVVSVYDSGSAITVTPYACVENVVVVKLDDENIFVGKKGDTATLPQASQSIIGYSDGEKLYQPNDVITVDKNIVLTTILRSIEESDFEIDLEDKTYSGNEIIAEVSALTGLVENVDYRVDYQNNTNVGEATVTVSGLGHYIGSFSKTFNIIKKVLLADDFSLENNSFVYTSKEIKPVVYSTVNVENYVVNYADNTDVGVATVTIVGKENCEGTVEFEFAITPKAISQTDFTVDTTTKFYTGEELSTDVVSNLVYDKDYIVEYADNTDVGTAIATVIGIGNYMGELTYNFDIAQKAITKDDFKVAVDDKVFKGEEIETEIESKLVLGEDYTVEYENNVNVGMATVIVNGIGNYCDELVYSFAIIPKAITEDDFKVAVDDKVFTGLEIETDIESALKKDVDYEVTYENNINTGVATVKIKGIGNYKGELSHEFNIAQREIVKEDFALKNDSVLFTGEALEPEIITNIGAENYDVIYSNNINEGVATVTITGRNNCSGKVVLTFKIVREFVDGMFSLEKTEFVYSGEEFNPAVISEIDAKNYEVIYENNINVGIASVKITAIGENYSGSVVLTFTIASKEIEKDMFSLEETKKIYTGEEIKVDIKSNLALNTDYIVEFSDNINVGTACVTIIGKGNYSGELVYNFDITPKAISSNDFTANLSEQEFTGEKLTAIITSSLKSTDYKVSYENNVNVGVATVKIIGVGNYCAELVYNFDITPKTISNKDFVVDVNAKTYTGSAIETEVESELVKDVDYKIEYENNVNSGVASVYVFGIGNYQGQTFFEYRINRKLITPADCTVDTTDKYYTGNVVETDVKSNLVLNKDYIVSYSNNIEIGQATIEIIGVGNYEGSLLNTFIIKEFICDHSTILVVGKVEATYFANGYSGDKKCGICSGLIQQGTAIKKLKLAKPKFTAKKQGKKIKVTYKKATDVNKIQIRYRIKGKWKIVKVNAKKKVITKLLKNLKKGQYKIQIRTMVVSGKKTAYSVWSKTAKVKIK